MWRLDPCADPVLRRRRRRAARPRSAPRSAPCPSSAPSARCASSSCPPGQDPDDLVRAGGREAFEALLAEPEPLDARLWRHELDAAPLTTPEARAGLRQRLIDHAGAIGDPALRQLYREEWLSRFEALAPAPPARRPALARSVEAVNAAAASSRPSPPPATCTRRSAPRHRRADRPRPDPRLRQFPRGMPAHCEQLAALPIADQRHRAPARRAGQRRLLRRRA